MPWLALTLEVDAAGVEPFSDALIEAGAVAVSLEDADAGTAAERPRYAEPDWDAPVAWARNRLRILLAEDADPAAFVAQAAHRAGLSAPPAFSVARVDDEDWVRRTQAQFQPVQVAGRLWIVPTWCEPPDPHATVIRLDPGLAFGTGTHPSTRLMLQWLAAVMPRLAREPREHRAGPDVLDYGCGSGILAIAAAKLGAAKVDAVDIDARALEATVANARANRVAVNAMAPQDLPPGEYDLVVANILANPLIALAPLLRGRVRPGGRLALSGILDSQVQEVIAAYAPGVELAVAQSEEGWSLLDGQRLVAQESAVQ